LDTDELLDSRATEEEAVRGLSSPLEMILSADEAGVAAAAWLDDAPPK